MLGLVLRDDASVTSIHQDLGANSCEWWLADTLGCAARTCELDAEAAQLDLRVDAPQDALVAVWQPRDDVACSAITARRLTDLPASAPWLSVLCRSHILRSGSVTETILKVVPYLSCTFGRSGGCRRAA